MHLLYKDENETFSDVIEKSCIAVQERGHLAASVHCQLADVTSSQLLRSVVVDVAQLLFSTGVYQHTRSV